MASRDVEPIDDFVHEHGLVVGPSSDHKTVLPSEEIGNPVLNNANELLNEGLRCVANLRRVNTFTHTEKELRKVCSLHGFQETPVDVSTCFRWLVRHLFLGSCITAVVRDGTVCAHVVEAYKDASRVARYIFDSVLSRVSFYSTDSLQEFVRVFDDANDKKTDRKSLLGRLAESRSRFAPLTNDITPSALFELLERSNLQVLKEHCCQHGLSNVIHSFAEVLRDSLMAHLCHGECIRDRSVEHAGCQKVVRHFTNDAQAIEGKEFQIRLLRKVVPSLNLRTLRRTMRLCGVLVQPGATVRQIRREMLLFVDRIQNDADASSVSLQTLSRGENDHIDFFVSRPGNPQRPDSHVYRVHTASSRAIQWPTVISNESKIKLLTDFLTETSSASLHESVCASCAGKFNDSKLQEVKLEMLDLTLLQRPDRRRVGGIVVDEQWLDSACDSPSFHFPGVDRRLDDIIVEKNGVLLSGEKVTALRLCRSCYGALKNGTTPDLALANHLLLGEVPAELQNLTVVEEAMIARCRTKSCIVQLRESVEGIVPNAQRALRGHVIVFPQEPDAVLDLLPPPLDEVTTFFCVVFVGSRPPTREWMHQHARPLLVRKERIQRALKWLQRHNRYYKHVRINTQVLDGLNEEDILPVHVDVVPPSVIHQLRVPFRGRVFSPQSQRA